jgi:4-amino-4-deoxy-L-arabinose transferase-like glycosyltransferase
MITQERVRRQAYLVPIAIFALALLTRLLWSNVPINIDEAVWIRRGPAFFYALLTGRLEDTYLRHHPGVTNMWVIGGGLSLRYLLRGILAGPDELARQSPNLAAYLQALATGARIPLEAYVTARWSSALVTSVCLVGIYCLSRRLFGGAVALITATILLFEPFFLAYQRSITTDANQTNFTWLAVLAFLLYLRAVTVEGPLHEVPAQPRRGEGAASRGEHAWLIASGAFFGLAVLSKISALLILPAFGLAALWTAWRLRTNRRRSFSKGAGLSKMAVDLLLWGLVAVALCFLLWPALWANLPVTLDRLYSGLTEEVAGHEQFLLGQTTEAPGILFYPLVLIARLSPLLLLGSLLGLLALAWLALRRYVPGRADLAVVLMVVVIALIGVSGTAAKQDRYIIPLIPGLALLTAAGIWAVVSRQAPKGHDAHVEDATRLPASPRFPQLPRVVLAVVAIQLIVLLPFFPYNLTYFSPFVGGPAYAQKLLMVGNGEMLDRAGAWLNRYVENGSVVGSRGYTASLEPYYRGPIVDIQRNPATNYWPLRDANYVVLYINQFQRRLPADLVDYFAPQNPLHTVRANGVDYARIYRGPAPGPADIEALANHTELDFGGKARLLGYELASPATVAGEPVSVALYWQAIEPFSAPDFTVHVGLRDADGNYYGSADRVPVGGLLPVDQWEPGQVVRDVQEVRVPPGTPPGDYTLEVGFFSPQMGQGLEVRDRNGPQGNRVPLATVKVTRPDRPAKDADLGIGNRVEGDIQIAAGGARLLGYEWPTLSELRSGDGIPLALLWQAGSNELANTQLHLQLNDGTRLWRRAQGHPLGGSYPPQSWQPGELVRDAWVALLPADAPAGRYRLEVVASGDAEDRILLDLGEVDILSRPHTFSAPQPAFPQEARLGDVVELVGYDTPATAQAGAPLEVTLYWHALGEVTRNTIRFVHLLDADDRIVAQLDSVPGDGDAQAPLTSWVSGEFIQDRATLPEVPPELPPGQYRLAVGLYDPVTGKRLAGPAGEDQILLEQQVEIQ